MQFSFQIICSCAPTWIKHAKMFTFVASSTDLIQFLSQYIFQKFAIISTQKEIDFLKQAFTRSCKEKESLSVVSHTRLITHFRHHWQNSYDFKYRFFMMFTFQIWLFISGQSLTILGILDYHELNSRNVKQFILNIFYIIGPLFSVSLKGQI